MLPTIQARIFRLLVCCLKTISFSVVLYGCGTCFLTLWEVGVSEKRVLRRILGQKRK
jgi:hypothetical protein